MNTLNNLTSLNNLNNFNNFNNLKNSTTVDHGSLDEFKAFVEAALVTESAARTEMYLFIVEPFTESDSDRDGVVTLSEFSEPPKEVNALKEKHWKLIVPLYGLIFDLKSYKNECKQSQVDPAIFFQLNKE